MVTTPSLAQVGQYLFDEGLGIEGVIVGHDKGLVENVPSYHAQSHALWFSKAAMRSLILGWLENNPRNVPLMPKAANALGNDCSACCACPPNARKALIIWLCMRYVLIFSPHVHTPMVGWLACFSHVRQDVLEIRV
jgi:hypothetical protein